MARITCSVIVDDGIDFGYEEHLADLVEFAAGTEPALQDGAWQLSIRLVDDASIAELHRDFFADPTPTDVITFPSGDTFDADGSYLGDIAISVDTASDQAGDAGHSPEREVAFLALHGLLHLCGYTDADDASRLLMLQRQTDYLQRWESIRGRPW